MFGKSKKRKENEFMNTLAVYKYQKFRQPTGKPVCFIEDIPENIVAFIMKSSDHEKYAFITESDEVKLFSMGCFLDLVPDQIDLIELQAAIIPMQLFGKEVPEVKYVEEDIIRGMIASM